MAGKLFVFRHFSLISLDCRYLTQSISMRKVVFPSSAYFLPMKILIYWKPSWLFVCNITTDILYKENMHKKKYFSLIEHLSKKCFRGKPWTCFSGKRSTDVSAKGKLVPEPLLLNFRISNR